MRTGSYSGGARPRLCKNAKLSYGFPGLAGGFEMARFVEAEDRRQDFLLPASLDD
jgi:hypothetical protein